MTYKTNIYILSIAAPETRLSTVIDIFPVAALIVLRMNSNPTDVYLYQSKADKP